MKMLAEIKYYREWEEEGDLICWYYSIAHLYCVVDTVNLRYWGRKGHYAAMPGRIQMI